MLIILLAILIPAGVIGWVGSSAIRGVARNPSASSKIFLVMGLSFIFTEAVVIVALLVIYNLFK